ncbi:hypothetical protein LSAT2_030694 [Lamellibrachia satsuma]|nr:hypothetical protein LSAT2_030694 [Lamellibrachia satsuma]
MLYAYSPPQNGTERISCAEREKEPRKKKGRSGFSDAAELTRSTVSPSTYEMTAPLTSLILLVLAPFGRHVSEAMSPRLRCPLACQCSGNSAHVVVSCINSYLTDIPQIPVDTRKLFINGNNISRLQANEFSELHKLTNMRIYKNNIRSIDEKAFIGLASLEHFYLSEEVLSSFERGIFRFFTNLTILSLRVRLVEVPQREICLVKRLRTLKLALFRFSSARFDPCFEELAELTFLSLNSMELRNISRATFHPLRASLTQLGLIKCGLRRLHVDLFNDLSRLVLLDLGKNAISSLPNNIFAHLTHLDQLNIASNKLKVISGELLRPLRFLTQLNIGFNPFVNVTLGEEFLSMTLLRHLILNGIKMMSLNNDTFRHLRHSPIVVLDMSTCSLRTISNGAFRLMRSLSVLSLDNNPLNSSVLHDALYGLQGAPLSELRLSNAKLRDFSTTSFDGLNDSDITTVVLKASHIAVIKRGVFRNLQKVTKLDLSANNISVIEDHSFEDLVRLSHLILDKNEIVVIRSAEQLSISSGLSWLSMKGNSIKKISQKSLLGYSNLTTLCMSCNNIRSISANAFVPTPNLRSLDLSGNKIPNFRPGTFDSLPDLRELNLYSNVILIHDPSLFQRLHQLTYLDFTENTLLGRDPAIFQSLLQNLSSLEIIHLKRCGIEALPEGMFLNTTRLRTLDLRSNIIKSWNTDVFARLHHLQILNLARNQVVSVNVASFSHLTSLRQLDLSLNPFACNCDLMWFVEYVQNNNIFLNNIEGASSYTCASPESLHGVPVLRAELSPEVCVSHTDLVVTLSTAAVIAVSAIVFTLVYRGRWYIRYYIFLVRSRRRRHLELADGDFAYDAFVAHSSKDLDWVVSRLLPQVEAEGRYRLCLHQRNWPTGPIIENIAESIEASRKIIIVMSNSFAQSHWCNVELAMASGRRLSNCRNSLVLVLLETISEENLTATLRRLLTTYTYLKWNEREEEKFWRALRKALRRPPGAPPIQMR